MTSFRITASRTCSIAFGLLACLLGSQLWDGSSSPFFVNADVMRPHNLDYLDVDTMNYYLEGPKKDYDVAVLFYAQWCNNCHAFAPIWDKISRMIHAGSKDANLIMGLFDCEKDTKHAEVCSRAGVKHYPTITFFSLSGQTFRRKQKATTKNPYPMPRHAIQFSGLWQYGDAVLDWIRTMTSLSAWHRAGLGQKLRSLFRKNKVPKKDQLLPLGVPSARDGSATAAEQSSSWLGATGEEGASSGSATPSSDNSAALALAQQKLDDAKTKTQKLEEIAVRSNILMGSMLQPSTVRKSSSARVASNSSLIEATIRMEPEGGKSYTDAFMFLAETDGWGTNQTTTAAATGATTDDPVVSNADLVLRSCVMEISLDYCTRVTTQATLDWIDSHESDLTEEVMASLETDLLAAVEKSEPYCLVVESCIQQDFVSEECRPPTCPFQEDAACRYLSACFEPEIHLDYAKALQVQTTLSARSDEIEDFNSSAGATSGSASGWGL